MKATDGIEKEAGKYRVNEVFYSIQGEGVLAGTPMVFVRLSHCNLRCAMEAGKRSPGGFDCDTEFESGRWVNLEELEDWIETTLESDYVGLPAEGFGRWMLLTGGEPGLQVDMDFCDYFRRDGRWQIAIETNGSILLPTREPNNPEWSGWVLDQALDLFPFDHITVSPKVAEHSIRQRWAHEVRYVRGLGQAVPETVVEAKSRLISPAFLGQEMDPKAVNWCVDLVRGNPGWRLSVQMHKLLGAR